MSIVIQLDSLIHSIFHRKLKALGVKFIHGDAIEHNLPIQTINLAHMEAVNEACAKMGIANE